MPLKGSLQDFSLPDLFQLIHFGRKNGTLNIVNGEDRGYVCFRNGNVFFATHNWKRPPLGQRLIEAETITEDQLDEALDLQKTTRKGQRLGNIMVELGYLSRESLEVFVEEQIRDAVFHLLRWSEGEFDFDPNQIFPEEDIGLSMSNEDLIMEGSRRLDEWYQIEKKVPSLDAVFEMTKVPGKEAADIDLTSEEWLVLYNVDGKSTVRDIIERSGQSALVTCKALYGLATSGLVALVKEEIPSMASSGGLDDEIDRLEERSSRLEPPPKEEAVEVNEGEGIVIEEPEEQPEDVIIEETEAPGEEAPFEKTPASKERASKEEETVEALKRKRRWRRSKKEAPQEELEVEEVSEQAEPEVAGQGAPGAEEAIVAKKEEDTGEKEKPEEKIVGEKPPVPGPKKGVEPPPGQSLVDYYKSLALEEASDSDRLVAFRDTEEKTEDEFATVEEQPEIEEPSVSEEEEVSEYREPEDVPLEWAGQLARMRGISNIPAYKRAVRPEAEVEVPEEEVEEEAEEVPPAAKDFLTIEQEVEAQALEDVEKEAYAAGEEAEVPEVPLVEEIEVPQKELVPSEEEIARLLEDTTKGREELTREELLSFDQPTYPQVESEAAQEVPVAPEAEEEEAVAEREEKVEARPEKREGVLGKVLRFGKTVREKEPEIVLEEPSPVVEAEAVEEVSIAEEIQLPAITEEVAEEEPEELAQKPKVSVEAGEEATLEEIPLVLETAAEPREEEHVRVEGPEEEAAEVVRLETARPEPAIAEELEVEVAPSKEIVFGEQAAGERVTFVPQEEPALEEAEAEEIEKEEVEEVEEVEEEPSGGLQVGRRGGIGTSLLDHDTFDLEKELMELARGSGKEEKKEAGAGDKKEKKKKKGEPESRKEKKGGKTRGKKEVDKGSVKKVIDDLKKL